MDRKKILLLLTVSPIVIECIALLFLPAQIPIHYNIQFQPDGYGSKYMLLILGVSALVFGAFMLLVYRESEKQAHEKLVYWLGVIAMLVCHVVNIGGIIGAVVS